MAGDAFDKRVMPSARAARAEDRRERRALPLYILIALLLCIAIFGIILLAR